MRNILKFIRLRIVESPLFEKAKASEPEVKVPILTLLKEHPRNVMVAMGARFVIAGNDVAYLANAAKKDVEGLRALKLS